MKAMLTVVDHKAKVSVPDADWTRDYRVNGDVPTMLREARRYLHTTFDTCGKWSFNHGVFQIEVKPIHERVKRSDIEAALQALGVPVPSGSPVMIATDYIAWGEHEKTETMELEP